MRLCSFCDACASSSLLRIELGGLGWGASVFHRGRPAASLPQQSLNSGDTTEFNISLGAEFAVWLVKKVYMHLCCTLSFRLGKKKKCLCDPQKLTVLSNNNMYSRAVLDVKAQHKCIWNSYPIGFGGCNASPWKALGFCLSSIKSRCVIKQPDSLTHAALTVSNTYNLQHMNLDAKRRN